MEVLKEVFGMKLREIRRERNLTLAQMGALTDLATPALSEIERGIRRPWPAAMREIARALGMDVRDVFPEEVERRQREVLETLGLAGVACHGA